VGRGAACAEHSTTHGTTIIYQLSIGMSWGTSFETGTRSGRAERRKDPPAGRFVLRTWEAKERYAP